MAFVDFNALTIIESLKPDEPHTGTELHNALQTDPAFPVHLSLVPMTTSQELLDHLKLVQDDATRHDRWPILHLELHGNENGLGFNDGTFLTWSDLATELRAANIALRNHLVITLAVCKGAYILRTLNLLERSPLFGILGSFNTAYAEPLRDGYQAFYKALFTTRDFNAAARSISEYLPQHELRTASDLFRNAYDGYRRINHTPTVFEARVNAIVQATTLALQAETTRAYAIQQLIEKDEQHRQELWRHFVMTDLDPRNATRCPLQ